ncbi:MAG: hypothetical protein OXG24_03060 [Gammaproteobacteria bacterium]|nr:hypothetical protein [Gammaproteobacteria bacterium]
METKRKLFRPIAYLSSGFLLGLFVLMMGSSVLSSPSGTAAECDNNWVLESGGDRQADSYIYQPCTGQVFVLNGSKATAVVFPK